MGQDEDFMGEIVTSEIRSSTDHVNVRSHQFGAIIIINPAPVLRTQKMAANEVLRKWKGDYAEGPNCGIALTADG